MRTPHTGVRVAALCGQAERPSVPLLSPGCAPIHGVTSEMHTPESCFPGVASQGHVAGNNDQRGDSEHAYHNGNRRLKKNAALQDAASWRTE